PRRAPARRILFVSGDQLLRQARRKPRPDRRVAPELQCAAVPDTVAVRERRRSGYARPPRTEAARIGYGSRVLQRAADPDAEPLQQLIRADALTTDAAPANHSRVVTSNSLTAVISRSRPINRFI